MHPATFFKKLPVSKVQCTACRHYCKINEGHSGICGVRQNIDGTLYLLVYGKAVAAHIDPIEKKPLYHFLPGSDIFSFGTIGCNFSCSFCQNWDISQASKDIKMKLLKEKKQNDLHIHIGKSGYDLPPEKIVEMCIDQGIPSIAYTYNEPAIFVEYVLDTARLARKAGIKNVLVSNGYESDESLHELRHCIDAMNIDLKSFSAEFYEKICGAKLENVILAIERAHKLGIWLELTTLIIPKKNDSQKEIKSIAKFIADIDTGIPWHVSAFHPDYKLTDASPTPAGTLKKARKIGLDAGLKYVYTGNIQDIDGSLTTCPKCKSELILRSGYNIHITGMDNGNCRKCGEKIGGIWK